MKKTKIINIIGAPSSGKSTSAHHLVASLKMEGVSCEYVAEYAKDLVYSGDIKTLEDQMKVTGEQYRRQKVPVGKVDYIVTDSPLLLGYIYGKYCGLEVIGMFEEFDNMTYFIHRKHSYEAEGRIHTEEESNLIEIEIEELLNGLEIDYKNVFNAIDIFEDLNRNQLNKGKMK